MGPRRRVFPEAFKQEAVDRVRYVHKKGLPPSQELTLGSAFR